MGEEMKLELLEEVIDSPANLQDSLKCCYPPQDKTPVPRGHTQQ